jgi:hypothetical protein
MDILYCCIATYFRVLYDSLDRSENIGFVEIAVAWKGGVFAHMESSLKFETVKTVLNVCHWQKKGCMK